MSCMAILFLCLQITREDRHQATNDGMSTWRSQMATLIFLRGVRRVCMGKHIHFITPEGKTRRELSVGKSLSWWFRDTHKDGEGKGLLRTRRQACVLLKLAHFECSLWLDLYGMKQQTCRWFPITSINVSCCTVPIEAPACRQAHHCNTTPPPW